MDLVRRLVWMMLLVAIIASIGGLLWYFTSDGGSRVIHVVVPEGFRGIATIIEDDRGADPLQSVGNDGLPRTEYLIPDDGVLKTSDASRFGAWHNLSGQYQGGRFLPAFGFDTSDPSVVALRVLGSFRTDLSGQIGIYLLIGNEEDAQEFHRTRETWNRIDLAN